MLFGLVVIIVLLGISSRGRKANKLASRQIFLAEEALATANPVVYANILAARGRKRLVRNVLFLLVTVAVLAAILLNS